jgi:conjugative transfer signal peptidase TraF
LGAGGVLLLGFALAEAAGLRINATASMPRGIWRVEAAGTRIARGEVVSICLPDTPVVREAAQRGYISAGGCPGGREPLLKPIAAIAGDAVAVTADDVAVNGEPLTDSAPLYKDSAGRPLQPIPAGVYHVSAGTVWLLSGHDPHSFDSRYFGAVPVASIQGIAHPIWVVE